MKSRLAPYAQLPSRPGPCGISCHAKALTFARIASSTACAISPRNGLGVTMVRSKSLNEFDLQYLVRLGAAGGRHLDRVALRFADERPRDGRRDGDPTALRVRL